VPPTFKFLRIPFTSIITFRGDRLSHEHISWDQATALHQAGLLPEWTTFPYAIDGREAAERKKFEVRLPVVSVDGANKLVEEGSVESNELITRNEGRGWREVDNI
jgi:carboxymethylenebutenolidase